MQRKHLTSAMRARFLPFIPLRMAFLRVKNQEPVLQVWCLYDMTVLLCLRVYTYTAHANCTTTWRPVP
jgi:hypothetical protein